MPISGDVFGQFGEWIDNTKAINDLELLTLKGHLMVEDSLKYLLAAKLRPRKDPEELAAKITFRSFPNLATLALVDEDDGVELQAAVLALNHARNKMSHWIDHPAFMDDLQDFVQQMNALSGLSTPWPSAKKDQLAVVRQALDVAATRILRSGIKHHDGPPPDFIKHDT